MRRGLGIPTELDFQDRHELVVSIPSVMYCAFRFMTSRTLGRCSCSVWQAVGRTSLGPTGSIAHSGAPATNRLLVIAPNAFHPALQDFVAYKQKLLTTEFRSLEAILQDTSGVDDPEKLKRFLYGQWQERGLGYVLLVGDVDVLPVRFMVLDRVTPAAFDYAFYPSDLYYADLAKPDGSFEDWNARKEGFHAGYFGEVRGEKNKTDPINYDEIHYLPEVAVGRWPVSTPEEARLVAGKTVAYEQSVLSTPARMRNGRLSSRLAAGRTAANCWISLRRNWPAVGSWKSVTTPMRAARLPARLPTISSSANC